MKQTNPIVCNTSPRAHLDQSMPITVFVWERATTVLDRDSVFQRLASQVDIGRKQNESVTQW